ncbi:Zn-ribbon domain-containing OB-fold protein [Streptomyces sp. XD-27]|uniref:Zn-ribbon domain-containing OB-fold protein n=1 Tax=Streptomyces sp. XD-27 TaxID=3062779 RepID=UPI0026F43E41|nr:OB-fold domain-containing protein [Streptomyces sp. XD-27]WKX68885.1 OB-fold domain-containing protein [Streptomyces sp. XD-27]
MFHTVAEIAEHPPAPDTPDTAPALEPETHVPAAPDEGWPGQIYLDGLQHGELYFQRCRWCHTAAFHRLLCPVCAATDMEWEASAGAGVVRQATVVRRSNGSLRTVAVIDMAEGFRLRATLSGVSADSVRPGTLVCLDPHAVHPRELTFKLADTRSADDRIPAAWR